MSYAELDWILLGLGFKRTRSAGSEVGYRHAATDTLLVFARHERSSEAKPGDVAAVQRMLEERGILGREDFASRLMALREREVRLNSLRAQLASYRQWKATEEALIDRLRAEGSLEPDELRAQLVELARTIHELELTERKLAEALPGRNAASAT